MPWSLGRPAGKCRGPAGPGDRDTWWHRSRDDGCSHLAEPHSLDPGERRSTPGRTRGVVLLKALARDG